ncbi:MAG: hypothetical protein ABS53_04140 [Hydrogenophaga sp. SCN 70-13]|uniref:TonB family protein n=1 Tax=Hydrogenophaga TaxID=47420 RepID=UPI00086BB871|nr:MULTISPECIES: TonB family protein [unclassified Hydrogenophaga]MBN9370741.1 TonB family protein [Hydrogenophaga sp.]ODT33632.1 MAG: hypothetical protein ABS53_04140 [Hydrogenophaga sp. SCN 70-13]OJV47923.1 MAG: hypothetical protein BGO22_00820 [Hydrogenophaga sp. 70-12]
MLMTQCVRAACLAGAIVTAAWAQPAQWHDLRKEVEALVDAHRYSDATAAAQRLDTLSEQLLPPISHPRVVSLVSLAQAYRAQGLYAKAERPMQQAIAVLRQLPPAPPALMAAYLGVLAGLQERQGHLAEADAHYQQALDVLADPADAERDLAAQLQLAHGRLLWSRQQPQRAQALLESSLRNSEAALGPSSEMTAMVLQTQAEHHLALGDADRAEKTVRRLIAIVEANPAHARLRPNAYNTLASSLLSQARLDEAQAVLQEAMRRWTEHQASGAVIANGQFTLARILDRKGSSEAAASWARKALDEAMRLPGAPTPWERPIVDWLRDQAERVGDQDATARYAAQAQALAQDEQRMEQRRAVTKPAARTTVPPAYPAAARRHGHTGVVSVRVRIGADGVPLRPAVASSSGYASLDQAALDSVSASRFHPARDRDGLETESTVRIPFRFVLDP